LNHSWNTFPIHVGNYSPLPVPQTRAVWRKNPRSPVPIDVLLVFPSQSPTRMCPARVSLLHLKGLITQQDPVIGPPSNNHVWSRTNNTINSYILYKDPPPRETTIPKRVVWRMGVDETHSNNFEHAGCPRQNSGASRVQPEQWLRLKTAGGSQGATVTRGTRTKP